jgi:hypothetical protein
MQKSISELRLISGLSWDQLGKLFSISRRDFLFWASGESPSIENETRVKQMLDIIRSADRGDAHTNRAMLLDDTEGPSAFILLVDGRFDEACSKMGPGVGRRPGPLLGNLSEEARAARKPLSPEILVDALNDRVHRDPPHTSRFSNFKHISKNKESSMGSNNGKCIGDGKSEGCGYGGIGGEECPNCGGMVISYAGIKLLEEIEATSRIEHEDENE